MLQTSNYSNILGVKSHGYGAMPRVSYRSPESVSSLKALTLPTKPVRTTSAQVGKAYLAAGQATACLHTMSILQAYQADLLRDQDEGGGAGSEVVKELRKATVLSLRATKDGSPGGHEEALWLNLSGIKERDKEYLLDVPVSPTGLFSDVIERFQLFKVSSIKKPSGLCCCWAGAAKAVYELLI